MSRLLVAQRAWTVPGWVKDLLWRRAQAVPSLDLRFADSKSLVDAVTGASLITFTRASSGTYVDSAGVLQTAAIGVPRFDHNPTTGESLGLLVEEQRTNLLLNSGTLSTQSVTVTAVAHTLHFTGTGTITLTGTSTAGPLVGTGTGEANRASLTFTPTAGSLTLTVSGTVTNAQLEAGAFRTSYIPTTAAAATRSADVASITGTNFLSWYNQNQGTLFAEQRTDSGQDNNLTTTFQFTSSNANAHAIGIRVSNDYNRSDIYGSGASAAMTPYAPISPGTLSKNALAYALNNAAAVRNGGTVSTDSSVGLPIAAIDRCTIGYNLSLNNSQTRQHVARLTYWPQRLPNFTLQPLTQ